MVKVNHNLATEKTRKGPGAIFIISGSALWLSQGAFLHGASGHFCL